MKNSARRLSARWRIPKISLRQTSIASAPFIPCPPHKSKRFSAHPIRNNVKAAFIMRRLQTVDKKLFSPEGGRIALSANEGIAEFLDFAIQVRFAYVNKLKGRLCAVLFLMENGVSLLFVRAKPCFRNQFPHSMLIALNFSRISSTLRFFRASPETSISARP